MRGKRRGEVSEFGVKFATWRGGHSLKSVPLVLLSRLPAHRIFGRTRGAREEAREIQEAQEGIYARCGGWAIAT